MATETFHTLIAKNRRNSFILIGVFMLFFVIFWDSFLVFWYSNAVGAPGEGGINIIMMVFPIAHVGVGPVGDQRQRTLGWWGGGGEGSVRLQWDKIE